MAENDFLSAVAGKLNLTFTNPTRNEDDDKYVFVSFDPISKKNSHTIYSMIVCFKAEKANQGGEGWWPGKGGCHFLCDLWTG